MTKKSSRDLTLFCFSPPVMAVTAVIELSLALYLLFRYRKHHLGWLTILTLVCLGAFQVAEYHICEGLASQNLMWTKLGLASITMLPALGLHLVEAIIGRGRTLTRVGYLCAAVYVILFVATNSVVQGGACAGNYVIIYTSPLAYSIYYYGFLGVAVFLGVSALHERMVAPKAHRDALKWLMLGYFTFLAPMAIVYMVAPWVVGGGGASIMCGFAVILALILGLVFLPTYDGKLSK